METSRWKQIDELFDAALDLSEDRRAAFLDEKCAGDPDLKKEVLGLLAAGDASDGFLDQSAMGLAAKNLADEQTILQEPNHIGRSVGTYRIEKQIGVGGMGEVFLAFDQKLKRYVAIKVLPREYTSNDERVKRFELEARAISALNHPNIVTIYDVGNVDGISFIATEFVEGKTLREFVDQPLRIKDALAIILQTCDALSAAHKAGIVHRDIKPENIMVRPDGYVKILDFGLAKLSGIDLNTLKNFSHTAKGIIIGTPAYMSPEQVADDNVDHRTDLWSIGVVLYELLTGVNPFKKESRQATFHAILSEDPAPASSLNSECGPELDQILAKALEKDADLSYQSASEIRADLKRVKREIDSSPSWSRSSRLTAETSSGKPSRRFLWSAPIILLVLAVGSWFLFFRADKAGGEATDWLRVQHAQLTVSIWTEGYPYLSPDGKNIAYAGGPTDNRDIYLQRVNGKNVQNLTESYSGSDTMPAFSPNGRFIAFRSERDGGGIFVMEETGENVRRIADFGFHPVWSVDSQSIIVSERAAAIHTVHTVPDSFLWSVDVKTGEKKKIETKGDAIMPSVSPNGLRIAFWFVAEGRLPGIATVPIGGGEPVIVAESDSSDWNPVWSPDGKFIYFSSDRGGSMNLWRVSVDEKTGRQTAVPESITTPAKYVRHITISRDGKTIVYVRYESQSNVQVIDFDPKTLKPSGEARFLTRGDRELGNPSLSSKSGLFVARNPQRTKEDLVVFDKNGENWRALTDDKFRERLPRWSPDGKRVAFSSDRSGRYQIWTTNADGSDPQQKTFSESTAAAAPVFSPDGNRLVFTESANRMQSSRILDLSKPWAGQTPQSLPDAPSSYSVRDWSPDGKKLLLILFEADGDENGTAIFDFETGSFQPMTSSGASPFWLNDSRHFVYTDRNTIKICDSKTKTSTEIYKPAAYEIQQAVPSPDNKQIFFRYLQVDADVWSIEAGEN